MARRSAALSSLGMAGGFFFKALTGKKNERASDVHPDVQKCLQELALIWNKHFGPVTKVSLKQDFSRWSMWLETLPTPNNRQNKPVIQRLVDQKDPPERIKAMALIALLAPTWQVNPFDGGKYSQDSKPTLRPDKLSEKLFFFLVDIVVLFAKIGQENDLKRNEAHPFKHMCSNDFEELIVKLLVLCPWGAMSKNLLEVFRPYDNYHFSHLRNRDVHFFTNLSYFLLTEAPIRTKAEVLKRMLRAVRDAESRPPVHRIRFEYSTAVLSAMTDRRPTTLAEKRLYAQELKRFLRWGDRYDEPFFEGADTALACRILEGKKYALTLRKFKEVIKHYKYR
jgi:hypothetical protein